MSSTINIVGTGGVIEGNFETANINVNLDAPYIFDGNDDYLEDSQYRVYQVEIRLQYRLGSNTLEHQEIGLYGEEMKQLIILFLDLVKPREK